MSNFWAQRLGVQPAPQPVQQQPAAPTATPGAPWWAPQPLPQQFQPAPVQQPQYAPQQQAQPEEQHHGWGSIKGSMAKAKSAKLTSTCGNCGSGNVFRPTPNAMEQCYDCGENPRFSQTGGEGGLPSEVSGPTQQARQISGGGGAGGVNNFNPQQVIGRVAG